MFNREQLSWMWRVIRSKLFDGLINLTFHLRKQDTYQDEKGLVGDHRV
jgi:hypothetical protein